MKAKLTIVEAVPGDNLRSYTGGTQKTGTQVVHRKLAGEKYHGKPPYGTERSEER